jgi:hypothetical protein
MFSLARKALVQVIMPVRAPFYVFLSAVVLRRCWSGSPPTQHRNGGHIMFNRKSSYALNKKDPNAIVYMDANEAIIRLTREDFASEEEFLKWKSLSDADYEHYLMGEIDLNTYKAEKAACNELLLKTKNAYAAVLAQAKQKQDEQARQDSRKEASKAIFDADTLTTELAELLIDRVLVYPDKRIEIAYKIQDIFD